MSRKHLMPMARSARETVVARLARDSAFAAALLNESASLYLNGEPEIARSILRDLVGATIGFEHLAALTDKPSKSLHRMLSRVGKPSMDNWAAILLALRGYQSADIEARSLTA